MPFLHACVHVASDEPLESVGRRISAAVLAGLPFGGREEFIYDEVPAIYVREQVLGLRVILQGLGGEHGYYLEVHTTTPITSSEGLVDSIAERVDVSENVACLLRSVDGLVVLPV